MPWPEYFFPKTYGRLQQLTFQRIADRRKAGAYVLMIARP
jgi:hypothetical protein